jgi:hypothetical protein
VLVQVVAWEAVIDGVQAREVRLVVTMAQAAQTISAQGQIADTAQVVLLALAAAAAIAVIVKVTQYVTLSHYRTDHHSPRISAT